MSGKRIFLIAGESSGDRLGAGIMQELKSLAEVEFFGVGGPEMEALGMSSIFPYHELALMGFAEVLPKIVHIMGRMERVIEEIGHLNPDMLITIDSPGFNFRVVEKLRKANAQMTFVHVVAPTVWAYKPERAEKCAKLFDHMLVLLPFEPPYFERVGLKCSYIGHPTVWAGNQAPDGDAFRKNHRIDDTETVIALLPGSRENEIKRHMVLMSQAIDQVAQNLNIRPIIVSSASEHTRVMMTEFLASSPYRSILVFDHQEKMSALAAANVALVKSGTVTLEVARAGTPMVVTYKVNPITAFIIRRLIKISQVSLINILEKQTIIPEYLQENATVENLSSALGELLNKPEMQAFQRTHFQSAIRKMQPPSGNAPQFEAAKVIHKLLVN